MSNKDTLQIFRHFFSPKATFLTFVYNSQDSKTPMKTRNTRKIRHHRKTLSGGFANSANPPEQYHKEPSLVKTLKAHSPKSFSQKVHMPSHWAKSCRT